MKTNWINHELFPFESRFLEIDGQQIHYIDEGEGPVIVFSHGTPEWSFGWRDLILRLRDRYRCIAPDLLGMGLSDKPQEADYSVQAHSSRLTAFIKKLDLHDIRLVANDFGVSIALGYAVAHPDNIQAVSIFNGWMWPVDQDPHFSGPAKFMRNWLGRLLYRRFNFPVNVIMPKAFGNRALLTTEIHRHYKLALPEPGSRNATYTFALELLDSGPWWAAQWAQLPALRDKPFLIFWGMKDAFLPPYLLEKWEHALPHAQVIRLEQAGHFAQEEAPDQMATELRAFFG